MMYSHRVHTAKYNIETAENQSAVSVFLAVGKIVL